MNKNILVLFVSSLTIWHLVAYDNVKLNNYLLEAIKSDDVASLNNANTVLVRISQGNEDADLTETLNTLAYLRDKKASFKESLKQSLPHALFWTLIHMEYEGIRKLIEAGGECGCFIKGDFNSLQEMKRAPKQWYICDKDGNKKIFTRADFYQVIKLGVTVAGGLWVVFGLCNYIYRKQYYKNWIKKILKTVHVTYDETKLFASVKKFIGLIEK